MGDQVKRKAAEAANQINQVNSNAKQSQSQQILAHLKAGNEITPMDALDLCGCFRLSARIADLRHDGWNISTKIITKNGKNFASYRLEDDHVLVQ